MANAQVNIRLIENRRDCAAWKVENGRVAIGTLWIEHYLVKVNTKTYLPTQVTGVHSVCYMLNIDLFIIVFHICLCLTFYINCSVYLDLFNIITKLNSVHLMFTMYMHVCMNCVCVGVWVCVRKRVCVRVCVRARVYVRVSQWVFKIFFFSIDTVTLIEICSFFISQICKYTWHNSLCNLCWDDVLYV